MPSQMQMALCEYCGWKRVFREGQSGLRPSPNDTMSADKFKCPGCGRAVTPRKIQDPQGEADRIARDDKAKSDNEAWLEKSMEYQREFIRGMNGQDID